MLCRKKYYVPDEANATCVLCPEGTVCNQNGKSTQSALQLKADYWRVSANSVDILVCPIPLSCKGDNVSLASDQMLEVYGNAYCETGYGGPLCGVCAAGTYFEPVALACISCGDAGVLSLFSAPTVRITMALFFIALFSKLFFWAARRHHHIKLRESGVSLLDQEEKEIAIDNNVMSKEKKSIEFEKLRKKLELLNDSMDVGANGTITFTKKFSKHVEPPATVTRTTVITLIAKIEKVDEKHRELDEVITIKTMIKPSNATLRTLSDLQQAEVRMKMLLSYGQVAVQLGFVIDVDFPEIYAYIIDLFTSISVDLIPSFGLQCHIDGYDYIHRALLTCAIPTFLTAVLFFAFLGAWVKARLKLKGEMATKKSRLEYLELSVPENLFKLLTSTELRDYKLVFMDFDLDSNGVVDRNELKTMVMRLDPEISTKEAEKQVEDIFTEVSDNGEEITFPEFLAAVEKSIHRSYGFEEDHVVAKGEKFAILAEMIDTRHHKNAGSWIISTWLVVGFLLLVCTNSSLLHCLNCHTFVLPDVDGKPPLLSQHNACIIAHSRWSTNTTAN